MEDYQIIYVTISREIFEAFTKEIEGLNIDGHMIITYDIQRKGKSWTLELKSFSTFSFFELGKRVSHLFKI